MGRPPLKKPKKQYTLMYEPEKMEIIDRISEKCGVSRSQLLSNLVDIGLDTARIYESIGVVSAVGYSRKIIDWFKKSKDEGKIVIGKDGNLKIDKDKL